MNKDKIKEILDDLRMVYVEDLSHEVISIDLLDLVKTKLQVLEDVFCLVEEELEDGE